MSPLHNIEVESYVNPLVDCLDDNWSKHHAHIIMGDRNLQKLTGRI